MTGSRACPLCGTGTEEPVLAEAAWVDPTTEARLRGRRPGWRRQDGACPACVQEALLSLLLERGEDVLGRVIQHVWPLDAEAAFGALPTPLRLRADPRFGGRGITIALVDAAFFPHPDLTRPANRIRAWVDARSDPIHVLRFGPDDVPRWPGWDALEPLQWHGLMTSAAAAGNGWMSRGLYRGMAPDAELVLVQTRDPSGRIGSEGIARALSWLHRNHGALGVRVVTVSLGGEPAVPLPGNAVDEAVAALVAEGVTVVVAAGNDGQRRLVPPATAADAITVGGLDDRNTFDPAEWALWHSSYGSSAGGGTKPDLVAPSIWVAAPILPGSAIAREAESLFARRAAGEPDCEARIAELKLVTPHYQHVEGTSFASPIVGGGVACLLEANPGIGPRRARELLLGACHPVPGAPPDRQGAGALDAGRAVALALADRHTSGAADFAHSPVPDGDGVRFLLHDHRATAVHVFGSWDGWRDPGTAARCVERGVWEARVGPLPPGTFAYKFRIDGSLWLADPGNSARASDGFGGWNSLFSTSRIDLADVPRLASATEDAVPIAPAAR